MKKIKYIDEVEIKKKTILVRVDFNVSLNPDHSIANDERIRQSIPTLEHLLKKNNKLVILSHLGRPKKVDKQYSLQTVVERLKNLLPHIDIGIYDSIESLSGGNERIKFLENIRFFPKEKDYSTVFAKKLASLGDVYVNDAFAVCHRSDTSVIGPPKYIEGFGGLLLKKEVNTLSHLLKNPKKPIVAIIGGAKVSTKIGLINKLVNVVDYLIIGGAMANTFINAQGYDIGMSHCEYESVQQARRLLSLNKKNRANIVLPLDAVVAENSECQNNEIAKIEHIPHNKSIYDLGPETIAHIGSIIAKAKTIIWNGPIGYFENPCFRRGTDFIYYSITENNGAYSVVGGGDTLAAISKKEYLDKITHISTGGGAMLEFIEKGDLPGLDALRK